VARVAVIGAGWAGLAAAVEATRRGHQVVVLEAARALGGRARTLAVDLPGGGSVALDNGQHILIGAYVETLRLMEIVGVSPDQVLLRLPLTLRDPAGNGIALPSLPAPLDAAIGIARARGWNWRDKASLLHTALGWQRAGFRCASTATVLDLAAGVTRRVREQLVEPLCVSALNTVPAQASGEVFLRVIRDALFGRGHRGWGGSNLLLPRAALGALFPDAAQAWLLSQGAQVRVGQRARQLRASNGGWEVDGTRFDHVVIATPPDAAVRLLQDGEVPATDWLRRTAALAFEPIATVYATGGPRLPLPLLALPSGPGAPAQFVFDRSQLGGPAGLLAFVISAGGSDRARAEHEVQQQAAAHGWRVQPLKTVVERHATFACVPGLQRPPVAIAPGLWACGDYVEGPYPATLEGAVRAGVGVAAGLR
jgi:squalene-associated FAD-dependent desaturase